MCGGKWGISSLGSLAIGSSILRLETKRRRPCVKHGLAIAVIRVQVCPHSPAEADELRQLHLWIPLRPEWGQLRGICVSARKRLSWRNLSSYGTWRWLPLVGLYQLWLSGRVTVWRSTVSTMFLLLDFVVSWPGGRHQTQSVGEGQAGSQGVCLLFSSKVN